MGHRGTGADTKVLSGSPARQLLAIMGHCGTGADRPTCGQDGCGRRAYADGLCHVCDSALRHQWTTKLLSGSPARQRSTPFQNFLENASLAKMTMEFVYGDGWLLQCHCMRRCPRPWLNAGWVCPVEYHRRMSLRLLDRVFCQDGYLNFELQYVDWDVAVSTLHAMDTDEIPWDEAVLAEFPAARGIGPPGAQGAPTDEPGRDPS